MPLLGVAFSSADIIFQKFLELHSTLPAKKDFQHEFFIFNKLNFGLDLQNCRVQGYDGAGAVSGHFMDFHP